jgi:lipid-binding SYLF domain-containing protein
MSHQLIIFPLEQKRGRINSCRKGERAIMNTHLATRTVISILCIVAFAFIAPVADAKTKGEIDASVTSAMARFKKDIKGGTEYLKAAKGVLVMPNVTKAAFVVGGQYGQGALQVGDETVSYYNLAAGSLGWQSVPSSRSRYLFMTRGRTEQVQKSEGWEAGSTPK